MPALIVEADGGSRGNPGYAGYGALVRDPASATVLAEVAEAIGEATNNVAEYRGLIAGLEAAAEIDPDAGLDVRMDSKLVVEQMSGRWKIKNPDLRPLATRAARLARDFAAVSYTWIPREHNAAADRLANEAMDAAAEGRSRQAGSMEQGEPAGQAPAPGANAVRAAPGHAVHGWMTSEETPTTTVLLRHGETPLSGQRRFSGSGRGAVAAELTERGLAQARSAAHRMSRRGGVTAIVSSPLSRTYATAEVVGKELDVPVAVDDNLREGDFGRWEGSTFAEVRDRWPDEVAAWRADPSVAPPGGESLAAVGERARAARDAVLDRYPGRCVLLVTHVTPIKWLVTDALAAPSDALYRMFLEVGSVCEVDWYGAGADGTAVVRSLNDTAHLVRTDE